MRVDTHRGIDIYYRRRNSIAYHQFQATLPDALGGVDLSCETMRQVVREIDGAFTRGEKNEKIAKKNIPVLLKTRPRRRDGREKAGHYVDREWFAGTLLGRTTKKRGLFHYRVKVKGWSKPWTVRDTARYYHGEEVYLMEDATLPKMQKLAKELNALRQKRETVEDAYKKIRADLQSVKHYTQAQFMKKVMAA